MPESEFDAIAPRIHRRSIDADGNIYEDGTKIGWQPPCLVHDAPYGRCRRCHQEVERTTVPESPDLGAIAHDLAKSLTLGREGATLESARAFARSVVVRVWNARGAADLARLDMAFVDLVLAGSPANAVLKHLDRALRSLDR